MSWANSLTRTRPSRGVPRTFPGVPANDNIRTPRVGPWMPPRPANDNMLPRRLPPHVWSRTLVRMIPLLTGALIVNDLLQYLRISGETWGLPGYELVLQCPVPPAEVVGGQAMMCHNRSSPGTPNMSQGYSTYRDRGAAFQPWQHVERWRRIQGTPHPIGNPALLPLPVYQPAVLPRPITISKPYVRYGYADGVPGGFWPQGPDEWYGPRPQPQPNPLRSQKPPKKTHERKFRAPQWVERIVGGLTEGLDYTYAMFNSLPMWRIFYILNKYRRLEVKRGLYGTVHGARLRYVALRPDQMMHYFLKYRNEVDDKKLAFNLMLMQASDYAWGQLGRRMAGYQRGPWDDPFYHDEPEPSDFEPYAPDAELHETAHGRSLMNDLFRKRLTNRERERIVRRWERYKDTPAF